MKTLNLLPRPFVLAALFFACGLGAAQLMQPANAQSGSGGSIAVSHDGTAWAISGGQVYHCYHDNYGDKCHGTN